MTPIQIQLLTGPGTGRRASFAATPITFGRDPDNTLVVEESTVSRKHGEIRAEGEGWVLVNLSPNGTRVNRRKVSDQPQPLRDGDTVFIEKQPLFNISIEPAAAETQKPTAPKKVKAPVNKKARLWLWLIVYVAAMLLGLAFLSTLDFSHKEKPSTIPQLSPDAITREISRPVKVERLDPDIARDRLAQARRLFHSISLSDPTTLFPAYRNFQEALAYSGQPDFGWDVHPVDDWNSYRQVQMKLIDEVNRQYLNAWNKRTNPTEAIEAFNRVLRLYPDIDSTIYENARTHVQEANAQAQSHRGLN